MNRCLQIIDFKSLSGRINSVLLILDFIDRGEKHEHCTHKYVGI